MCQSNMFNISCPICKYERYEEVYIQTRSPDEPHTLFYKCKQCSKEWRPFKEYTGTGIRSGLSLAMAITMPISQAKFDSTRTTGKVSYEGPDLDSLLEDRKSEYVTYTFHRQDTNEVKDIWNSLLDIEIKGNILNLEQQENGKLIVYYLFNDRTESCDFGEIQNGKIIRKFFDMQYPEIMDITYIPTYLRSVYNNRDFTCFSVFSEDCIDKLKEYESTYSKLGVFNEVVGTNFHSMLKHYKETIVIEILKDIFMDTKVLNEDEAKMLANDMIRDGRYIPIKDMSLSSPLEKMLYTGSLATIREFVVNKVVDPLNTPLSASIVKKIIPDEMI